MAIATFAAGCFWGVQARFDALPGVTSTEAGYTGGTTARPTYEQVCSHLTGHAEAVRIEFDPAKIAYDQLLDAFFAMHDPTTLNRQGPDIGSQYRSAVFAHDEEQDTAARAKVAALEAAGAFRAPIVTEIVPAGDFWRAEEYHQMYLRKHRGAGCAI